VTPASWEVLFYKKDGPIVDVVDLLGSANPLTIEWTNTDDNKFMTIIGSKVTIGYMYQGSPGEPLPDLFIDIEEDTWLIVVNKNGNLYWKGFLKPDNSGYPFIHPPFEFRMNATDYFQVMKSRTVDLNDPVLFLYDYITLKDFVARTLFHAVDYDDAVLRVLCTIHPNMISPADLFDQLYLHTDALFDFDKGPLPVYDCLNMICQSFGMRMFYAAGSYWMQRVADLDQQQYTVLTLRPNADVVQEDIVDVLRQLGTSAPQNDMWYLERTQSVYITPALKKQDFTFKLRGINQLKNFDWRFWDGTNFANWNNSDLETDRVGNGSIEDPYKVRVFPNNSSNITYIAQRFPIVPGQLINLQVKSIGKNVRSQKINISIQPAGGPQIKYVLLSSGEWSKDQSQFNNMTYTIDKNFKGTLDVRSVLIPFDVTPGDEVVLYIGDPVAVENPPMGEDIYNDIYPVFLRLYDNNYQSINESITNNAAYSLKPDELSFFFLDTQDSGLSNNLFYDDAGVKKALPAKSWQSYKNSGIALRDLDEYMAWSYLDAQQVALYNVESDVFSNVLEFHNVARCVDLPGKQFMLLRDKYDVRNCRHSLMIAEVKNEGTSSGIYEVTPVTDTNG
jgi:hypothetical protein